MAKKFGGKLERMRACLAKIFILYATQGFVVVDKEMWLRVHYKGTKAASLSGNGMRRGARVEWERYVSTNSANVCTVEPVGTDIRHTGNDSTSDSNKDRFFQLQIMYVSGSTPYAR